MNGVTGGQILTLTIELAISQAVIIGLLIVIAAGIWRMR